MGNLKIYQIFLFFFLISVTFIIFSPTLDGTYSTLDDHIMLRSYSGSLKDISKDFIVNTFKNRHEGLYHPLVTLSYSLEKTLFGFIPAMFHFDNVLLHIFNTILVFLILLKLSDSFWLSFIVTALFAIHPTRAEVVCWISSRKDLLYSVFYLLSVFFYVQTYDNKKHSALLITGSILLYLLACLSKSMAITLPFVLIILDLYKNVFSKERIKIYLIYLSITVLFVVITIIAHYLDWGNARFQFDIFRQTVNFINAHFNILFYLDKLILPINLYCMYPFFYNEFGSLPPNFILYSPAALYLLIYFCYLSLAKTKVIFYGFMFFLISIIPVSSILPIGLFVVADRYTYIPYLGLFFIFAKLILYIYNIPNKFKNKILNLVKVFVVVVCLTIFGTLSYLSFNRVFDWKMNLFSAPIGMKYYEFGIKKNIKDNSGIKRIKQKAKIRFLNNIKSAIIKK